jgi:peptidyl-prolyl cis-trans isomerase D
MHDFVGPVKGRNGVYVYQVMSQSKQAMPFNEAQQEEAALENHIRNLSSFASDLYIDGKVVDKRYLFF